MMHAEIRKLWAQTRLHIWPESYALVSFPAGPIDPALLHAAFNTDGFAAVLKERDEVSFTLCQETWEQFAGKLQPRAVAGPYRVITFDLDLALSICGYFAPAAVRLAEAGVAILPQCAYRKDHVLFQAGELESAVQALTELIAECQRQN